MHRTTTAALAITATTLAAAAPVRAELNFAFVKIADTNDLVPDGSGGPFWGFANDIVVDGPRVAFRAADVDPRDQGIYAFFPGMGLIRIANEDDTFPGSDDLYTSFDDHVEFHQGRVIFYGLAANGNNAVVLSDPTTAASPRVIVRKGETLLPNGEVVTYVSNGEDYGFSGWRLAFEAKSESVDGTFLWTDGALDPIETIFLKGDAAPSGGTFGSSNCEPMPDGNGPGVVLTPSDDVAGRTVTIFDESGLHVLVDDTTLVPDGSGDTFTSIGARADIDRGVVVFDGEGASGQNGIYRTDGETVERIIDTTMTLPDGADYTQAQYYCYENGTIVFKSRDAIHVWREGVLQTVVSVGDTLDDATVTDMTTLRRDAFDGRFIGLNLDLDGGPFEGGTQAVYRVEIVSAFARPGDVDRNGSMDANDVLHVVSEWGADADGKGGPADLDGNGQVDFGDLLGVLRGIAGGR